MLNWPPLNPPRLTSYGEVVSELVTAASRGRFEASELSPLIVVEFWSAVRPNTEKPDGSPSAPGMNCTPGSEAAIAARSPCCSAESALAETLRSVPLMSAGFWFRLTRFRSPAICTVSRFCAAIVRRASATRMSWSAVRFTWKVRGP